MSNLKYTIIKSREQYDDYCDQLFTLTQRSASGKQITDEIELLTLLIEKWDEQHNSFQDKDPVSILKTLMKEHDLKAKDLADILSVSRGLVSDILSYKKGLSKEVIRNLSDHFKVAQKAFNRPYKLKLPINSQLRNASVMNTPKKISADR